MDHTTPGGAGVLKWANTIRLNLAKDPGRQLLHDQIQNTLDFMDDYLENVLKGPKTESVTELLKTPGRRKNAPTRTKSTTVATVKKEVIVEMSLDRTDDERGTHAPVNSFHKALLQAKNTRDEDEEVAEEAHPNDTRHQKADDSVWLAHAEEVATREPMAHEQVQDRDDALRTAMLNTSGASSEPVTTELSIIAEDDESTERSRLFALPPSSSMEVAQSLETEAPKAEEMRSAAGAAMDVDVDDLAQTDVMSTTDTFHSIPLDSPTSHTTPAPKDPSPVVEEPGKSQEPIPIVPSATTGDELSVPLRDEPSSKTLDRTPGLSQIGLPAPSPLHKSTKTGREQSMGAALGPGAKRGSWLVKAREVKAMEVAGKRTSNTLGSGLGLGILGVKRKSGEMLDPVGMSGTVVGPSRASSEDDRVAKLAKLNEDGGSERKNRMKILSAEEPPSLSPKPAIEMKIRAATVPPEDFTVQIIEQDEPLLNTFKKRLEGARTGKSMGKSLGGTAAAALAQARAEAEARVAERNKLERGSDVGTTADESVVEDGAQNVHAEPATEAALVPDSHKRLSVSDLFVLSQKEEQTLASGHEPPLPALNIEAASTNADASISTTPPNSPPRPATIAPPTGPVFSKPAAVFAAPPSSSSAQASRDQPSAGPSKDFSFKMPSAHPFSLPAAMALGVPASLGSPNSQKVGGLSAQSSKASVFSDMIFDKEDSIPAWMPQTQDTEYSTQPAQSQKFDDTDDDDSWHVDDKFAAHQMWTPFGFTSAENRDDTWSTLPSRSTSQKGGDTGFMTTNFTKSFAAKKDVEQVEEAQPEAEVEPSIAVSTAFGSDGEPVEHEQDAMDQFIANQAMEMGEVADEDMEETDLEDIAIAGQSTVSLVQPSVERSQSQQSMAASTASSLQQSQAGLFGQATKFVNSMLGGGKKKPEPVKSLQLAAQAAKKQQEELEKKAARLKEMENRRQLAQQRKAEGEQVRAQEEEKKIREENERRKREREELTDKRPLSRLGSKKQLDDDNTKKRKIEAEKKPIESKKPPSKDKKDVPPAPRVAAKSGPSTMTNPPGVKVGPPAKSAMKQTELPETKAPTKVVKPTPSSSNLKAVASSGNLKVGQPNLKGKGKAPTDEEPQPAQAIRAQMADRAKAQIQAQLNPPPVASETIELPDINSEYSDSEDEDRPRNFDPPDWAQSPELRAALQQQAAVNPDDVFGQIPPLRMEDMFRTRQSRFRARTSSANWSGPDGLTEQEEREYARRMGFK
ncbi:hypothetical protein DAEQUDRAFT_690017 [Daedalea quercina L-15889]|uniref:Inner centromere protein ARK-binding domain-containing protein n=1 Tax=Daedalea quercina L-15889 TaxID=1314783 RepID=A0A165QW98_9APHY|nr:hypothetical protein DAEQUDRAFT_690017 [Daedalea quercina L-15889]